MIIRLAPAILLALLLGCATRAPVKEVQLREVVVTRTERPISEAQLPVPPVALGERPADLSAALDLAVAQLCAWISFAEKADALLQLAAGIAVVRRVNEPVCDAAEAPLQSR